MTQNLGERHDGRTAKTNPEEVASRYPVTERELLTVHFDHPILRQPEGPSIPPTVGVHVVVAPEESGLTPSSHLQPEFLQIVSSSCFGIDDVDGAKKFFRWPQYQHRCSNGFLSPLSFTPL